MSAYPTDFPGVQDAYQPAEPGLFLGVDPLIAALLALAVLGGLVVAYLVGRGEGSGRRAPDAVDAIHQDLLDASREAMIAGDADLLGRCKTLRRSIDVHLGPLLTVAKGAGGPVKALDQAIAGKKEVEAKPKPDTPHPHPPHPSHGPAHPPSAVAAAAAGSPVIVNVLGGVAEAVRTDPPPKPEAEARPLPEPAPPPKPAPAPAKATEDMTIEEQVHALARATREFHAWWSDAAPRKAELRAVVRALTTAPAKPPHHGHGGHGARH